MKDPGKEKQGSALIVVIKADTDFTADKRENLSIRLKLCLQEGMLGFDPLEFIIQPKGRNMWECPLIED